jgi:DNA-binding transcriptional regulator/RsmH inhibitor MraZ
VSTDAKGRVSLPKAFADATLNRSDQGRSICTVENAQKLRRAKILENILSRFT